MTTQLTVEHAMHVNPNLRAIGTLAVALLILAACGDDAPAPSADAGTDALVATQCTADSQCDDTVFCNGAELCAPASTMADARGCVNGTPPCAADICDETANTCDAACPDADNDGVTTCNFDCDDADPNRSPVYTEVCDGDDEDCDPTTFGTRDIDGDGHVDDACCNGVGTCGDDCDDTRAGVHPGLPEVCNRRDDDCSGTADDDDAILFPVYPDLDRDGDGDASATSLMLCPGGVGYASTNTDCEDAPSSGARLRSGRTAEVTDGIDNDCDGVVDEASPPATWYEDLDGDGYGTRRSTRASGVVLTGYALLENDCDDGDSYVNPGAPAELCNAIDDDCDGLAGFELGVNDFEDDDGDGFTDVHCGESGTDCDDGDPARYLGAPERCNLVDDDCDGTVDEACSLTPVDGGVADAGVSDAGAGLDAGAAIDAGGTTDAGTPCTSPEPLFRDSDGDGYGVPDVYVVTCPPLAGYSTDPRDCDDTNAARYPGAIDSPGVVGVDDDCSGVVDG